MALAVAGRQARLDPLLPFRGTRYGARARGVVGAAGRSKQDYGNHDEPLDAPLESQRQASGVLQQHVHGPRAAVDLSRGHKREHAVPPA